MNAKRTVKTCLTSLRLVIAFGIGSTQLTRLPAGDVSTAHVLVDRSAQSRSRPASPRVPAETWMQYRDIEQAGFSTAGVDEVRRHLTAGNIDGLLVVHDGVVVLRHGHIETRYMCHSIRKSYMSMLYGIYVANGRIDVTKTLAELNIDDTEPSLTNEEKQATVADLLKSRSGVYHTAAYEPRSMKNSRPERGSHRPGTHWWYNNWDFNVLLTIFEQETGEKFFEAFRKHIADPLQLQDFRLRDGYYHPEPGNSIHPAYPFRLSARDMARIGLVMARQGRWGDQQIVPAEWVKESTESHSDILKWNGYNGYGYMWWIARSPKEFLVSALGTGNNAIDVLPKRNLVIVFRANTYRGKNIRWADRWRVLQSVLRAQTGTPVDAPDLVPLKDESELPRAVSLTDDYLSQFPLDLRRQLPQQLPAEIRDRPVRIERTEGTLVLYTAPPPALQFDLIPLAEDRFFLEGPNEIGVIDRDEMGRPRRFLLKGDLAARITELKKEGRLDEARKESELANRLFGEPKASDESAATDPVERRSVVKGQAQRPVKYRSDSTKVMMKNVYVLFTDKSVKNVTPTPGEGFYGGGCIHPDGHDVVFPGAAWGYSRIWKFDFATDKVKPLTAESFASTNPSYSADGQRIVFVADRDFDNPRFDMFEVGRSRSHNEGFKGGMTSFSSLYVMNADGTNVVRITSGDYFDRRPSFSPDGRTIVFLSNRGHAKTLHLWTIPSDGSSPPTKLDLVGNPWAGRPRYSPDGKDIFFFSGIADGKYEPTGRHTLCRVFASGGAWQVVANDTLGVSSHGPDPDPDGKHLWYHAAVDNLWSLCKLPLDGGRPVRVIPPGFAEHHVAHPTIARNGTMSFDSRSYVVQPNIDEPTAAKEP